MKKAFTLLFITITLASCSLNNDQIPAQEKTILGRWHVVGFEETVLYEFTKDLRHTIYSTDGNFGSLSEAIPNPNSWTYNGNELIIDLSSGNFLKAKLNFKCDNNVLSLVSQSGTTILYREGYDYKKCNE
ncbi:hypothetical protein [uncultured Tenacibaculum sp.]|uniref:hypothetical protein n=1 Tax=uncultured Tenacibaculum sp. TaxID=174713 RepID=UPI002627B425|nr:hypothetical protein [uncultured Tenacibaculum sp.]